MTRIVCCLCALWLAVGAPSAATACSVTPVRGADMPLPQDGAFDQRLASAAILAEVNAVRCAQGRRPLDDRSGLVSVAVDHSRWMAQARRMAHRSGVPGRNTLRDKLDAAKLRYRRGAENLAIVPFHAFFGSRFGIEGRCRFRSTTTGALIPRHTYASMARELVSVWMASPGHRRTILSARYSRAGAGVALDATAEHCGRIYATQLFAD